MKHSAVAWSFGKDGRTNSQTYRNPGPGAYSLHDTSTYKVKAPHWKIGTAKRSSSFKENIPGPGNYEIKAKLGDAPKYTMRPKTGTEFGKSSRDPGPGAYNPDVKKNDDYKFTMRIRPQSASALMKNPGPGTYNLRKVDSDLLKPNSIRFGTEKKHKDVNFTYMKNPGPGNYDHDKNKVIASAPKFSFGKEDRGDNKRPKTPGPGQYEAKKIMGNDGPKIGMSFYRPLSSVSNKSPGPGEYQPKLNYLTKAPEYKIGTSQRVIVDKETRLKPGPGQYHPDKIGYVRPKSPQWVMGTEQRGDLTKTEKTPGPGNYEYKKTVGEAPKVRF